MAAPKGYQPPGGSRKGIPNKATADLKAMILGALDKAGGLEYLSRQAIENPGPFMALIGKVLPKDVMIDQKTTVTITMAEKREQALAYLNEVFGQPEKPALH